MTRHSGVDVVITLQGTLEIISAFGKLILKNVSLFVITCNQPALVKGGSISPSAVWPSAFLSSCVSVQHAVGHLPGGGGCQPLAA